MKEKIAAEKGWEASQQKLIYSGPYLLAAFLTAVVKVWTLVLISWC